MNHKEIRGVGMAATASLNTKIDLKEKDDFVANAAALGMSPSTAIKIFVSMFNRCKGFPFDVRLAPQINSANPNIPHASMVDGHLVVPASWRDDDDDE